MNTNSNRVTSVPPTPGERAAAEARWERRGILGRLVRVDDTTDELADGDRRPAPVAPS
jgi:hypothetical protein